MKSKDKSVCLTRLLLIIRLSLVVDLIFLIVHVHVQHTGMELETLKITIRHKNRLTPPLQEAYYLSKYAS